MLRSLRLPAGARPGEGRRRQEGRSIRAALAFLLPNLIGFAVFTLFPVALSFGMAFTNWSLKPAVRFQFVGLRNFTDILGIRPEAAENPVLAASFLALAALTVAGAAGSLWVFMSGVKGSRLGGLIVFLACLAVLAGPPSEAATVGAAAGLIVGGLAFLREGEWRFGAATIPSLLLAAGAFGLGRIGGVFGEAYAPRDPYFWQYLYNTVYLMLGMPVSIGGSIILAVLLDRELPLGSARTRIVSSSCLLAAGLICSLAAGSIFGPSAGLVCGLVWAAAALGAAFGVVAYRTLFYLPTFTAGVALMILWQALYNPKTGPINAGLDGLFTFLGMHVELPRWLSDVAWAKPALIFMGVWTSVGGTNMLLYLAALTNVPKELHEAASLDGAGAWVRFRSITWPQLAPTTFFVTVMSLIGGLQGGFEQARVLTAGGPAGTTTTISYYIYNKAFQDLDMGYASAIAWVLFAVIFGATIMNWKFGRGLEVDG